MMGTESCRSCCSTDCGCQEDSRWEDVRSSILGLVLATHCGMTIVGIVVMTERSCCYCRTSGGENSPRIGFDDTAPIHGASHEWGSCLH